MSGSASVCDNVAIPEFTKILPAQIKALADSSVKLECEVSIAIELNVVEMCRCFLISIVSEL